MLGVYAAGMVPTAALYHVALREIANLEIEDVLGAVRHKSGEHWVNEAEDRCALAWSNLGLFNLESSSKVAWPAFVVWARRVAKDGRPARSTCFAVFFTTDDLGPHSLTAQPLSSIDWSRYIGDQAGPGIVRGDGPELAARLRDARAFDEWGRAEPDARAATKRTSNKKPPQA